jgi:hydrogenase expression/formation protein HypC
MCLAIPARVLEVNGLQAVIAVQGVRQAANLMLLEGGAQPGDFILLHAGFAIRKWSQTEGEELEALWREVAAPEEHVAPD